MEEMDNSMNSSKQQSNNKKKQNDRYELSWEDVDYDVDPRDLKSKKSAHEMPVPTGTFQSEEAMGIFDEDSKTPLSIPPKEEEEAHTKAEADDDADDDWLSPAAARLLSDQTKPAAVGENRVYLTRQFKTLNTPASKKKSRCVNCTRPLDDIEKEKQERLCGRCVRRYF